MGVYDNLVAFQLSALNGVNIMSDARPCVCTCAREHTRRHRRRRRYALGADNGRVGGFRLGMHIVPCGSQQQNQVLSPISSPVKISEKAENEPVQLGKRSLDAIVEGVVARLQDSPPEKRLNEGSGSSSAGKGE